MCKTTHWRETGRKNFANRATKPSTVSVWIATRSNAPLRVVAFFSATIPSRSSRSVVSFLQRNSLLKKVILSLVLYCKRVVLQNYNSSLKASHGTTQGNFKPSRKFKKWTHAGIVLLASKSFRTKTFPSHNSSLFLVTNHQSTATNLTKQSKAFRFD